MRRSPSKRFYFFLLLLCFLVVAITIGLAFRGRASQSRYEGFTRISVETTGGSGAAVTTVTLTNIIHNLENPAFAKVVARRAALVDSDHAWIRANRLGNSSLLEVRVSTITRLNTQRLQQATLEELSEILVRQGLKFETVDSGEVLEKKSRLEKILQKLIDWLP